MSLKHTPKPSATHAPKLEQAAKPQPFIAEAQMAPGHQTLPSVSLASAQEGSGLAQEAPLASSAAGDRGEGPREAAMPLEGDLEAFVPTVAGLRVISRHSIQEVVDIENAINRTGKHEHNPYPPVKNEADCWNGRAKIGFCLVEVPISLLSHQYDPHGPDAEPPSEQTEARIEAYRALSTEAPPCLVSYAGRHWPPKRGLGLAFVQNGNHRVEAARRNGRETIRAYMPAEDFDFWATTVAPNLEPRPVRQVDTPEFRAWFRGSKVVNPGGEPLVVHHGSSSPHTTFESGHENGWSVPRAGHYFTDDIEMASEFGEVRSYYLSIQTLADLRYNEAHLQQIVEAMDPDDRPAYEGRRLVFLGAMGKLQTPEFLAAARRAGFGGIVMDDQLGNARYFDSYIAFDPTRIKSATDNCGAFDPANPDVRA